MIQRIQTLYILSGTILCMIIFFFIPFNFTIINATTSSNLFSGELIHLSDLNSYLFFMMVFLNLTITILALFSFQKLNVQRKLVIILLVESCLIIFGSLGYMLSNYMNSILDHLNTTTYAPSIYFIIFNFLPFIFYYLAYRAIKKDADLINSINRLR